MCSFHQYSFFFVTGEKCILHGDDESEKLLSDFSPDIQALRDERNADMESVYDYGARAGFWRLYRLFTKRKMPVTVYAVGMALERNPAVVHALREQKDSWEVASHGYRWIDYNQGSGGGMDEQTEREHIARTVKIHERLLGKRPVGLYQGKVCSFVDVSRLLRLSLQNPADTVCLTTCTSFAFLSS
jgi:allantoinase